MPKLDPFSSKRIEKFAREFRQARAQLPTLADFEKHGIAKEQVAQAVKEKVLGEFYVTLTTGAVVKAYKALRG